ncbi:hypothetical protein TorRG33x02_209970 [Trema orientale]|uniref:Transmembrane protein n=1 Tax=Trema orientale TaxID=63057 RepID=A0A2P5EC96_TREOI|nr:hypothetical protein TorRG33x02_209970 [Trema orientale]
MTISIPESESEIWVLVLLGRRLALLLLKDRIIVVLIYNQVRRRQKAGNGIRLCVSESLCYVGLMMGMNLSRVFPLYIYIYVVILFHFIFGLNTRGGSKLGKKGGNVQKSKRAGLVGGGAGGGVGLWRPYLNVDRLNIFTY